VLGNDEVLFRSHVDSAGQQWVTVWSPQHGSQPPAFPFVMYALGTDTRSQGDVFTPENVFRALNMGSMQSVPWRLEYCHQTLELVDAIRHFQKHRGPVL